jgi:putative endonuclease
MYYVYVIKSLKNGSYYKGMTENISKRLCEHNSGKQKYTKQFIPWKLVYLEEYSTREEARKREIYFKTAAGRRYLKTKLTLS